MVYRITHKKKKLLYLINTINDLIMLCFPCVIIAYIYCHRAINSHFLKLKLYFYSQYLLNIYLG